MCKAAIQPSEIRAFSRSESGKVKKRRFRRQRQAAVGLKLVRVQGVWGLGMGDYGTAIWVTIGLAVVLTIPVVWQFLQPNDDDFGDLTRRK